MHLPSLPQIKNKREANITPHVLQYLRTNNFQSCAFEIKYSKKNTIPRSALKDHQKKALLKAKNGTFVYKIADTRRRLPFDGFVLNKTPAFVIACFKKKCFLIDIEEWKGCKIDDKYTSFSI